MVQSVGVAAQSLAKWVLVKLLLMMTVQPVEALVLVQVLVLEPVLVLVGTQRPQRTAQAGASRRCPWLDRGQQLATATALMRPCSFAT